MTMKEISAQTKSIMYDNKNSLHFNSKATKKEILDYLELQSQAIKELTDREFEWQHELTNMAGCLSNDRIAQKDMYVAQVEQECEDKIGNLNVIIAGKDATIADLNKQIVSLQFAAEADKKKGFFARIFGW